MFEKCWKNTADMPSGSGAFVGLIVLTTSKISLLSGILLSFSFWYVEMTVWKNSLNIWHCTVLSILKRLVNSSRRKSPIWFLLSSQIPSLFLSVAMKILLQFVTVAAWKNFEFQSPVYPSTPLASHVVVFLVHVLLYWLKALIPFNGLFNLPNPFMAHSKRIFVPSSQRFWCIYNPPLNWNSFILVCVTLPSSSHHLITGRVPNPNFLESKWFQ